MGGVVLISLSPSACVLVCERRRKGTGDSGGWGDWGRLYGAWMPGGGKTFSCRGSFSSGCQAPAPERRGDV